MTSCLFVDIAAELKPSEQNGSQWTKWVVTEGNRCKAQIDGLKARLTEFTEFKVAVKTFYGTLREIIVDYANFMRNMIKFCAKVVEEGKDQNTYNQAMLVFVQYLEGARYVYGQSVKWNMEVEPPFSDTAYFISRVISSR
jgi:hypothetical protein